MPPARRPPEPDETSWVPALAWTLGCFLVPVALFVAWAMTRSGTPPLDCFDDTGAPCPSPRAAALGSLLRVTPGLIGAATLALLIAVGLRLLVDTWRAAAVGMAAAVVGAGIATLIATAFD